MKTGRFLAASLVAFVFSTGLAQAKIPVAPMDDAAKAKAEEVKAKAAEAAKKEAEQLAKAQDSVVAYYKKSQGKSSTAAPAKSAKATAAKN